MICRVIISNRLCRGKHLADFRQLNCRHRTSDGSNFSVFVVLEFVGDVVSLDDLWGKAAR